ncbi:MAG: hypothetical protein AB1817_08355 [Chloroflexota bacterium]
MAKIEISDKVYDQVTAFKPVIESILDVSLEFDRYVELLLRLTPDLILSEVLVRADPPALIRAIEELAQRNPKPVYTYLAEEFRGGQAMVEAEKKADVKKRFGIRIPEEYKR